MTIFTKTTYATKNSSFSGNTDITEQVLHQVEQYPHIIELTRWLNI